jgi:hypothetical protein
MPISSVSLKTERTEKSLHLVVGDGAEYALARKACILAPETRAFSKCRNQVCAIPVDYRRMTNTPYERDCMPKLEGEFNMKQRRLYTMVYRRLIEHQTARKSRMRNLLFDDSSSNNAYQHILQRALIA